MLECYFYSLSNRRNSSLEEGGKAGGRCKRERRREEILAKDSDAFFKGRKKEFAYRPLLSTRYECAENIFVLCKLDSSLSKNKGIVKSK